MVLVFVVCILTAIYGWEIWLMAAGKFGLHVLFSTPNGSTDLSLPKWTLCSYNCLQILPSIELKGSMQGQPLFTSPALPQNCNSSVMVSLKEVGAHNMTQQKYALYVTLATYRGRSLSYTQFCQNKSSKVVGISPLKWGWRYPHHTKHEAGLQSSLLLDWSWCTVISVHNLIG